MAAHPGLDVSPNVFVARDGFEHGLKMDSYLIDEGWTRLSRDWLNEHEHQETYDESGTTSRIFYQSGSRLRVVGVVGSA